MGSTIALYLIFVALAWTGSKLALVVRELESIRGRLDDLTRRP